jgi:hypothetical protein
MFCIYCGTKNPKDASFCSTCGKAIGTSANPPVQTTIPQRDHDGSERTRDSNEEAAQPMSLPAQSQPQAQSEPAAGKSKIALWILVGFAACLVIVIAVGLVFRQNQDSSGQGGLSANSTSDTPRYTAPAADDTPSPVAAPASAPVQPPSTPAAVQNPIIGEWKTTTLIGDTVLIFTDDGHYSIKSALVSDSGVYVFSAGDGTLRLQPDAMFSHDIIVWSCQLSGNSLSVVDPDGAGHVYTRFQQ